LIVRQREYRFVHCEVSGGEALRALRALGRLGAWALGAVAKQPSLFPIGGGSSIEHALRPARLPVEPRSASASPVSFHSAFRAAPVHSLNANSSAAMACRCVVSSTGRGLSSGEINSSISVHPSTMACAPHRASESITLT